MTHTYALLEVSDTAYCEVRRLMLEAGYEHALNDRGELDMHGIAIIRRPNSRQRQQSLYDGPDPKIRRHRAL